MIKYGQQINGIYAGAGEDMVENVLREVVSELSGLPFVEGIVLGG